VDTKAVATMADTGTAKLFKHGRSQAVRLPKDFRMPGSEVRVRRIGRGILLEPIDAAFDVDGWFAAIDQYLDEPFMPDGRQQPANPPRRLQSRRTRKRGLLALLKSMKPLDEDVPPVD